MLYNKGVYINSCFDEFNLTNPEIVKEVHRDYIQSGVDIIETNTFGTDKYKLKKFGLEGIQISPPLGKYELALEVLKPL